MQTRLKVIVGVGAVLICGALCFTFLNTDSSNSETSTVSTSTTHSIPTTSSIVVNKSKAYEIAEQRLQKYVENQFNSSPRIEIGSEIVADEFSSTFVIEIKGNASGYVDENNDDYNKMIFTFSIWIEKDGGDTDNEEFDYYWKY